VSGERGSSSEADDAARRAVEVYKVVRAHELMLNQATSAFEHATIAPLLLVNGGGAVAFLALLGALADPKSKLTASTCWAGAAIAAWALGLVSAALAAGFGLRYQRAFSQAHRIQRQQMERLLLSGSELAEIVAPMSPKTDLAVERKALLNRAKRGQRLYELAWWVSITSFVFGAGFAGLSVL
jgi:hypothetical protein